MPDRGTPTISRRPLHLLLAEDNVINQRIARKVLENEGHTVLVARNGREALALAQTGSFDLILMDVQMPEMDGFDATAAIRKLEAESAAHVPIIGVTAHAMKGDHERCLAAGMDGYVSKPIRPAALFAAIEKAVPTLAPAVCAPAAPAAADGAVLDYAPTTKAVGSL